MMLFVHRIYLKNFSAKCARGLGRSLESTQAYSSTSSLKYRILASDSIDAVCGDVFKARGHEFVLRPGLPKDQLLDIIGDFDGLVVRSGTQVDKDIIDAGSNLKIIGRAGTGVDNIDVQYATQRDILVVNTPGGNTISTAELAFSHILALARNIPQATAALKEGRWDRALYTGSELNGKTVGIIGAGAIGREVAKRCRAFGMTIVGYDPVLSDAAMRESNITPLTLEDLFKQSDFITIHTPKTKDTTHLINEKTIASCKEGVRIVNCARGGIVDEDALLRGLESGHVAGAGLDVLETEPPTAQSACLRAHPNVIMTPHQGASTRDAQVRVAHDVARNMSDIYGGGAYVGVVNAPDMSAVARGGPELTNFVRLAECFGGILSQRFHERKLAGITISMAGKNVTSGEMVKIIKTAVLKGCLTTYTNDVVTMVNASSKAKQMGLPVEAITKQDTKKSTGFKNQLSVEFEFGDGSTANIEGTVHEGVGMRITSMDGLTLDCPPGRHMIFFENDDQPGVLHKVADILGAANINIENFSLGRVDKNGRAVSAVVVDMPCSELLMRKLRTIDVISDAKHVDVPLGPSSVEQVEGNKPQELPANPEFSSGPCKKRPGWAPSALSTASLGRSHRSTLGKKRLALAISETRRILEVPDDYHVGIVPASDTGAFEMAMWTMLGERPIDACFWESFGEGWKDDAIKHLGLQNTTREFTSPYGQLPDLSQTNPDHDILFTFNGTTSGVRVPNLDWISDDRTGLTFNDATSAAFAMEIDWSKVDVTTFSWQKVLGGEGAHGVMILSPRAVARLESFTPARPLPKIFRLTNKGKVNMGIFKGETINTPSMLCVEDYIDALDWCDRVGGVAGLISRSQANLGVLEKFVAKHDWIDFLAADPSIRSNTSVCLVLNQLDGDQVKAFAALLEKEGAAYDIGAYRDAPDGLRIWCGATVEKTDLEALLPWLKWAHDQVQYDDEDEARAV